MISRRTSGALRLVLILVFGCAFAPAQDDQPGRTHAGSATIAAWSHAVPDLFPPSAAQFVDSSPNSLRQPGTVWHRMADFYLADWKATAPAAAEPVIRRGLEAPLSSPPFPSSDWSYGGASTIGAADGNVYPTMSALQQEGHRTHLYGWVEASANASSSSGTNYPVTYGFVPNRPALNQAMLILERLPDTTQASRFDWGFHVSGFFGTDYRYTTSKGYVSNQLLKDNHQYGFDPLWESVDFYLPIKEGLVIRIGRFPSMPGIETQLAPSNFTITHSLAFSAAPSTETGAVATLKLTSQWMAQLGISAGHDVAPWTVDRKPSAIACVNYSTQSNHDNLYACANGINDGRYAYNNVQQFDLTWNHRFNAKWHMASEAWYMYERAVPNVEGNVQNPLPPETGANGAHCIAGQLACTAPAYAWVNYLNRAINPHLYVGFRSDMLDDRKGQRTGIPGKYTENTLYATKNFGTTVMLRPELRFDHSWDRKGYNNGTARNQVFFGADLIYKF
ncbi:MAG: outer membrane beta-barrel protein [Edaphobacter sp.]|uniref:outer membrane beta-barrel protein n=1 Tax=Edaphobacter sp. TaxID=1934404 RepID=UPI00238A46DF|nr:outer membrane beta-barrel protein [Edaphobacter sp.]MDE1176815.1 outer membrane beta-barrel protein [Edaphobacter sp.]